MNSALLLAHIHEAGQQRCGPARNGNRGRQNQLKAAESRRLLPNTHEAVVPPHRGERKPKNERTRLKKVVPFSGLENGAGYANSLGNSNPRAVFRARKTASLFPGVATSGPLFRVQWTQKTARAAATISLAPGSGRRGVQDPARSSILHKDYKGTGGSRGGRAGSGQKLPFTKGHTKRRVGAERGVQDQQPKAPSYQRNYKGAGGSRGGGPGASDGAMSFALPDSTSVPRSVAQPAYNSKITTHVTFRTGFAASTRS